MIRKAPPPAKPEEALSLSKKSIRTFSTSCLQNRKIKNSILFCDFGRCGG